MFNDEPRPIAAEQSSSSIHHPTAAEVSLVAMRAKWIDFYDSEQAHVVRFVMRLGAGIEDACDATQEAFMDSWRLMATDPDAWARINNQRGWIRVVAARKHCRPPGSRRRPLLVEGAPIPDIPQPGLDPGELTVQTQIVLQALGGLEEQARLVMALRMDDVPTKTIAQLLEVSDQRVRDITKAARAALKRTLAQVTTPEEAAMTDDVAPNLELTDEQLDDLLAAADQELLDHIRTHADPITTLTAIMVDTTSGIRHDAARIISARSDVGALIRALIRDPDPNLYLVLDQARVLARNLDLVHDRTLDRDRTLARTLALDLIRALDPPRAFILDRARARVLTLILDIILDRVQIEASGVDLSKMQIKDLKILKGVIWTDETMWPPDIEDQVHAQSWQIRPGVYQFRGGNERDPSDMAGV